MNNKLNPFYLRYEGAKANKTPFKKEEIDEFKAAVKFPKKLDDELMAYFVFDGNLENNAYNPDVGKISMLNKDGTTMDVSDAADLMNISVLSEPVQKYFLCYTS